MPIKLTFETVSEFIKSNGDTLISTEYINNKTELDIKCEKCNKIYKQTFDRFKRGYYHQFCDQIKNKQTKRFGGYKKPITLKPIICSTCSIEFQPKRTSTKLCSVKCARVFEQTSVYKENAVKNGQIGGKISATKQSKRSKNEVYFSELCENYFEITTNEPYFDGWDADVIIHAKKLAILWNGAWHYKQISKTQSLKQVQARDKVKTAIIERYGYTPYVIKDMGKHNKAFVEQEFEIFLLMRIVL